jgi:hypothetical protein
MNTVLEIRALQKLRIGREIATVVGASPRLPQKSMEGRAVQKASSVVYSDSCKNIFEK